MTLDQTANYTPKHRRDIDYVGKHREHPPGSRALLAQPTAYPLGFAPKHCLGAASPKASRDLGCRHTHPLEVAKFPIFTVRPEDIGLDR